MNSLGMMRNSRDTISQFKFLLFFILTLYICNKKIYDNQIVEIRSFAVNIPLLFTNARCAQMNRRVQLKIICKCGSVKLRDRISCTVSTYSRRRTSQSLVKSSGLNNACAISYFFYNPLSMRQMPIVLSFFPPITN